MDTFCGQRKRGKSVYFGDESKFNVFGSDGKTYVRRRMGERLDPKCKKKTVKFRGGSVMAFGMISSQGTTPLILLNTRENGTIYRNLLQNHVVSILQESTCENPIFIQDNASCHKTKLVMECLKKQNLR